MDKKLFLDKGIKRLCGQPGIQERYMGITSISV